MSVEVILPKLGFSMSEGTLSDWMIADGQQVEAGAPLYSLESDKSVTEVEAPASGILRVKVAAGETYPVGTILAVIE